MTFVGRGRVFVDGDLPVEPTVSPPVNLHVVGVSVLMCAGGRIPLVNLRASPTLTTQRFVLRGFVDDDLEPLAAMNADPEVMRYLGGVRSHEWSAATIDRCRSQWGELGFGRFAIEDADSHEFVGWVTLEPAELAGYADDVEIGWRLVRAYWSRGIATESAGALLTWAFESLPVDRILAVADSANAASVAVMRRLGMVHLADVPDDGRTSTVWCKSRPLGADAPS